MSDEVVGTAILIPPNGVRDLGYIHFVARRGNGECFVNDVPIVPEESYAQAKAYWDNRPLWAYRIEGDMLHCHPSVNDLGAGWHNSYNWSVKFRLYNPETDNRITQAVKQLNPEFPL